MNRSSTSAPCGLPASEIAALQNELNGYAQELTALETATSRGGRPHIKSEEAVKCIQNFTEFFDNRAQQYGAHMQVFLGQHVCSNVVFVVLQRVVKPALVEFCQYVASDAFTSQQGKQKKTQHDRNNSTAEGFPTRGEQGTSDPMDYRGEKKARNLLQHIARPFRQLLQALHRHSPMEPTTASLLLAALPSSTAGSVPSAFPGANSTATTTRSHGSSTAPHEQETGARPRNAGMGGNTVHHGSAPCDGVFDVYGSRAAPSVPLFSAEDRLSAADLNSSALMPSGAILLYKQAAPLLALLRHLLEVLQSAVLSPVIGAEYASLLNELLNWSGYVLQIPGSYIVELCDRLMELLEQTGEGDQGSRAASAASPPHPQQADGVNTGGGVAPLLPPTVEDGIVYAQLLAKLFLLPQITSAFHEGDPNVGASFGIAAHSRGYREGIAALYRMSRASVTRRGSTSTEHGVDERGNVYAVVWRLIRLLHVRHAHATSTLKLEATLLTALRQLTFSIQYDFPHAARLPLTELTTHLCDFSLLPETTRKDVWRLELYSFLSQQLCIHYGSVVAHSVLEDVVYGCHHGIQGQPKRTGGRRSRHTTHFSDDERFRAGTDRHDMSPLALRLLHEVLVPMVLRIFAQTRHRFSFVSRRELYCYPCPATDIKDLFEFGAVVFYLSTCTFSAYERMVGDVGQEGIGVVLASAAGDAEERSLVMGASSATAALSHATSEDGPASANGRKRGRDQRNRYRDRFTDQEALERHMEAQMASRKHRDPAERFLTLLTKTFFLWTGGETEAGTMKPHDVVSEPALYGDDEEAVVAGPSPGRATHESQGRKPRGDAAAASTTLVRELNGDAPLHLLHLLTEPATTLHFTPDQVARLVENVLLVVLMSREGARLTPLILGAIQAILTASPPTVSGTMASAEDARGDLRAGIKQRTFAFLLQRYLPSVSAAVPSTAATGAGMAGGGLLTEGHTAGQVSDEALGAIDTVHRTLTLLMSGSLLRGVPLLPPSASTSSLWRLSAAAVSAFVVTQIRGTIQSRCSLVEQQWRRRQALTAALQAGAPPDDDTAGNEEASAEQRFPDATPHLHSLLTPVGLISRLQLLATAAEWSLEVPFRRELCRNATTARGETIEQETTTTENERKLSSTAAVDDHASAALAFATHLPSIEAGIALALHGVTHACVFYDVNRAGAFDGSATATIAGGAAATDGSSSTFGPSYPSVSGAILSSAASRGTDFPSSPAARNSAANVAEVEQYAAALHAAEVYAVTCATALAVAREASSSSRRFGGLQPMSDTKGEEGCTMVSPRLHVRVRCITTDAVTTATARLLAPARLLPPVAARAAEGYWLLLPPGVVTGQCAASAGPNGLDATRAGAQPPPHSEGSEPDALPHVEVKGSALPTGFVVPDVFMETLAHGVGQTLALLRTRMAAATREADMLCGPTVGSAKAQQPLGESHAILADMAPADREGALGTRYAQPAWLRGKGLGGDVGAGNTGRNDAFGRGEDEGTSVAHLRTLRPHVVAERHTDNRRPLHEPDDDHPHTRHGRETPVTFSAAPLPSHASAAWHQQDLAMTVQCVQLLHLLLRLYRCGLWQAPEDHPRGSREEDSDRHDWQTSHPLAEDATFAQRDQEDLHVLRTTSSLFTEPDAILLKLSPNGSIFYTTLWLCHTLSDRLMVSPRQDVVAQQAVYRSLRFLYHDCGAVLVHPRLSCAEARQVPLTFSQQLAQHVLYHGLDRLSAWRPTDAASMDMTLPVYDALRTSLDLQRHLLLALSSSNALSMAPGENSTSSPQSSAQRNDATHVNGKPTNRFIATHQERLLSTTMWMLSADTLVPPQRVRDSVVRQGEERDPSLRDARTPLNLQGGRTTLANGTTAADHGDEQALHPMTHTPFTFPLLSGVAQLLNLVQFLWEGEDAGRVSLSLVHSLFARCRFSALPLVFSLVQSVSDYAWFLGTRYPRKFGLNRSSTAAVGSQDNGSAETVRRVAELLLLVVDQLMDAARTDMPTAALADPSTLCALLTAICRVLPWCPSDAAERLGKFSFEFLSSPAAPDGGARRSGGSRLSELQGTIRRTSYGVRCHTALQVGALFSRFRTRAESVLREMLFSCREGILSSNPLHCAASLLALSEACLAAPRLEATVVYTLLECWATRGFMFRPLLLQCMSRIAGGVFLDAAGDASSGTILSSGGGPLVASDDDDDEGDALGDDVGDDRSCAAMVERMGQPYVLLCTAYVRPLLYWWLCRDRHGIDALPVECFGQTSLESFIRTHAEALLPTALLLLLHPGADTPSGPATAEHGDVELGSALWKRLNRDDVLVRVAQVCYTERIRRAWSGAGVPGPRAAQRPPKKMLRQLERGISSVSHVSNSADHLDEVIARAFTPCAENEEDEAEEEAQQRSRRASHQRWTDDAYMVAVRQLIVAVMAQYFASVHAALLILLTPFASVTSGPAGEFVSAAFGPRHGAEDLHVPSPPPASSRAVYAVSGEGEEVEQRAAAEAAERALLWLQEVLNHAEPAFLMSHTRFSTALLARAPVALQRYLLTFSAADAAEGDEATELERQDDSSHVAATGTLSNWTIFLLLHTDALMSELTASIGRPLPVSLPDGGGRGTFRGFSSFHPEPATHRAREEAGSWNRYTVDNTCVQRAADALCEALVSAYAGLRDVTAGLDHEGPAAAAVQRSNTTVHHGKATAGGAADDVTADMLLFRDDPVFAYGAPTRNGPDHALNRLLSSQHGAHAYTLLQSLYTRVLTSTEAQWCMWLEARLEGCDNDTDPSCVSASLSSPVSPSALGVVASRGPNQWRFLSLWSHVCTHWCSRAVYKVPHSLRCIISECIHLLTLTHSSLRYGVSGRRPFSGGPQPGAWVTSLQDAGLVYDTVCNVLLHVWPIAASFSCEANTTEASVSPSTNGGSRKVDSREEGELRHVDVDDDVRETTLDHLRSQLAVILMPLADEAPVVASTWSALCRSDPKLAARDYSQAAKVGTGLMSGRVQREGTAVERSDEVVVLDSEEEEGGEPAGKKVLMESDSAQALVQSQTLASVVLPLLEHAHEMMSSVNTGAHVATDTSVSLARFVRHVSSVLRSYREPMTHAIARHVSAKTRHGRDVLAGATLDGATDKVDMSLHGSDREGLDGQDARLVRVALECADVLFRHLVTASSAFHDNTLDTRASYERENTAAPLPTAVPAAAPPVEADVQVCVLALLRDICLCFVDADAVELLDETFQATQRCDVVRVVCQRRQEFARLTQQRKGQPRDGQEPMDGTDASLPEHDGSKDTNAVTPFSPLDEALFGIPYAAHLQRLSRMAFDADPHVAALAADALANWLTPGDPSASPTAGAPTGSSRGKTPNAGDANILSLMWLAVTNAAAEENTGGGAAEMHRTVRRLQATLLPFGFLSPQVLGLPEMAVLPPHAPLVSAYSPSAIYAPTSHTGLAGGVPIPVELSQLFSQKTKAAVRWHPLSPLNASLPSSPGMAAAAAVAGSHARGRAARYSLLDETLFADAVATGWRSMPEDVFLPRFTLALIHTYNLDVKFRALAACVPLMEYEAATAAAAAAAETGEGLPRKQGTRVRAVQGNALVTALTDPCPRLRAHLTRQTPKRQGRGESGQLESAWGSPMRSAAALLPLVLHHVFLTKETETMRGTRASWGRALCRSVAKRPLCYPVTSRLLLTALDVCRLVSSNRVRVYGLKDSVFNKQPQPSTLLQHIRAERQALQEKRDTAKATTAAATSSTTTPSTATGAVSHAQEYMDDGALQNLQQREMDVSLIDSCFGVVPITEDMQAAHWLQEIPARTLALAAAALGEPHLAMKFLELSGESLIRPRGGIPSSLMSSGAYALLAHDAQTTGDVAGALDAHAPYGAAAHLSSLNTGIGGAAGTSSSSSSVSWLAVAGAPYSVLFPSARKQDYAKRGTEGSAGATRASHVSGGGRDGRRGAEKGEALLMRLYRFEQLTVRVSEAVRRSLPLDPPSLLAARRMGMNEGVSNASSLRSSLQQRERWNVPSIESPSADVRGDDGDGGMATVACKVRTLLDAGLPETALEVAIGAFRGGREEGRTNAVSSRRTHHGTTFTKIEAGIYATEARLMSLAAEAAWQCGVWGNEAQNTYRENQGMNTAVSRKDAFTNLSSRTAALVQFTIDTLSFPEHMQLNPGKEHCVLPSYHSVSVFSEEARASRERSLSSVPTTARGPLSFHEAVLLALDARQAGDVARSQDLLASGHRALQRSFTRLTWLDTLLASEGLRDLQECCLLSEPHGGHAPRVNDPSCGMAASFLSGKKVTPASLLPESFLLQDELRAAAAQVAGQPHGTYAHTVSIARRAIDGSHPERALRWLLRCAQHYSLRTRVEPLQRGDENPISVVSDEEKVELTLLYAQSLYLLERPLDAVECLQRREGVTATSEDGDVGRAYPASSSDSSEDDDAHAGRQRTNVAPGHPAHQHSFGASLHSELLTLPRAAGLVPRVVLQTLQWVNALQLAPPSRVVRDPLLTKAASQDTSGRSSLALGRLCHRLATDIADRLRTHESRALRRSIRTSRQTLDALRRQREMGRPQEGTSNAEGVLLSEHEDLLLRKRISELEKEVALEEKSLNRYLGDYALFRRSALNAYARYLQHSGTHGEDDVHAIFGFVELWLPDEREPADAAVGSDGADHAMRVDEDDAEALLDEGDPNSAISRLNPGSKKITDDVLRKALQGTPTAKFLPLYHQLAARLGGGRDEGMLTDLLVRVATEHPLMCVWPLLALSNGQQYGEGAGARRGGSERDGAGVRATDLRKVKASQAALAAVKNALKAQAAKERLQTATAGDIGYAGDGPEETSETLDLQRTQEMDLVKDPHVRPASPAATRSTKWAKARGKHATRAEAGDAPGRTPSARKVRMLEEATMLTSAYMELAYYRPTPRPFNNIDAGFRIRSDVVNLLIPPPTELPSVLASHATSVESAFDDANRLPTLCRYAPFFTSPGGINVPKVIRCELSDGTVVSQLLKANDDLRQDALVEQVFTVANMLLRTNVSAFASDGVLREGETSSTGDHNTGASCAAHPTAMMTGTRTAGIPSVATMGRPRRHVLAMRTYNVVPLAPAVGVVQWVPHTTTLGDYLNGPHRSRTRHDVGGVSTSMAVPPAGGAHERYYPGEPTSAECRERLAAAPRDERHAALLGIYADFSPALHYFFFEHFPTAEECLEKQQVYVRSAAVSSMVGFLVGLGDRHASNLLMETRSAELVHIDLGIAFDQNKLLHIPELVPFRLTRNIVDGFGVRGTEGGFQSCCERVLQTLRSRQDMLLTVLSAFLHDPLARWAIVVPNATTTGTDTAATSARSMPRQTVHANGAEPSLSKPQIERCKASAADARRTMGKVAAKLSGHDGSDTLTVPSQVRKLVEAAQSTENLAAMFQGWSPWL